jgi:TolB protein
MNIDRLRMDLTELAEEATPVDLRDRALRSSRRLGIQRAVATSAAVLVMLGAATGTAIALVPRNGGGPAPATTATTTVDSTPSAAPSPTTSASAAAGTPSGGAKNDPAATIGRIFYIANPVNPEPNPGPTPLFSWTPGGQPHRLTALPWGAMQTNAAVSPDGRKIAWIDEQSSLNVAAVDGTGRRKLHDKVEGQCWGPTWSPDSRRLTAAVVESTDPYRDRIGMIDVSSGAFSPTAGLDGCHPVWAADADRIAAPDGSTGQVYLFSTDGPARRAIPNLGGSARYGSADIASISPDGSKLALLRRAHGENAGDVARELTVNAVLDTRTGAEINLPLDGRQLLQAVFQADGTLVARVKGSGGNVLVLIGADGRKISESHESPVFKGMQILSVTR